MYIDAKHLVSIDISRRWGHSGHIERSLNAFTHLVLEEEYYQMDLIKGNHKLQTLNVSGILIEDGMSANSVPLAVNPDVLRPRYHVDAWALMELGGVLAVQRREKKTIHL